MQNKTPPTEFIEPAKPLKKSERRLLTGPKPETRKYQTERHEKFSAALRYQMSKYGDTIPSLLKAISPKNHQNGARGMKTWRLGTAIPTHHSSFELLEKIEWRYGLPEGYFADILRKRPSATQRFLQQMSASDQMAFKWHLPRDFEKRTEKEQHEIEQWIRGNVLSCSTDYGKYQSIASQNKYAIVFPTLPFDLGGRQAKGGFVRNSRVDSVSGGYGTVEAPKALAKEITALISFMTAPLPPTDSFRARPWSKANADLSARRLGEIFGALVAAPQSTAAGRGASLEKLTLGLLAFPKVLEWYLQWRQKRRGFYAVTERSLMYNTKALLRFSTGWIRQHPELARKLRPIQGLITANEIARAKRDWRSQCDTAYRYAADRAQQLHWVVQPVRDPFLAITPVLNSDQPLKVYKTVGDEIVKRMPDESARPAEAAVAVRNYLLFRFAIHLGFRQRNLRELLLSPKGTKPRSYHQLVQLRRGEIRWNESRRSWEVFAPAAAFKNSGSSYFKGKSYQHILPRVGGLYRWIDLYLKRHRHLLLGDFDDPNTFFIKETRKGMRSAEFELYSLYDAWTLMIQRYGIYNPYTKRGAIRGLLPHGPHCVRDVLATHILKTTNSYELAGYAIQDTVQATMRHYARFLPHEKAARAAEVVNKVWG